jgi:hypothetical protein
VAEAENNDLTDVVQITWTPETTPPVTRVDRPLQNGTYLDTALTTFSGVARDSLSTVVKVEIALRKYLVSGKCKNWSGSMFVSADCGARTWVLATIKSTDPDTAIVNWTYDLPAGTRLARSDERNGAAARVYLLLARATDSVGNVETVFVDTNCTVSNQHPRGCNRITFEIKASGT